jgi:hypothetical protein
MGLLHVLIFNYRLLWVKDFKTLKPPIEGRLDLNIAKKPQKSPLRTKPSHLEMEERERLRGKS